MTGMIAADRRHLLLGALLAGLALLPALAAAIDQPFLVELGTRIAILALAAVALDLVVGQAGLVAFGQAGFVGLGAYATGILIHHGILSGWVHLAAALGAAGLAATAIGWLSLRTGGIHFIMITLAFGQMLYYLANGLEAYGGDDGLPLAGRSVFGFGLDLARPGTLLGLALALLAALLLAQRWALGTRWGLALKAGRANEGRLRALGIEPRRLRLGAFVASAQVAATAGLLLANQHQFVSPTILHWTKSGELLVMVLVGGLGSLGGPVLGAAVMVGLEQALPPLIAGASQLAGGAAEWGQHWRLPLGLLLVALVLAGRRGLWDLIGRGRP